MRALQITRRFALMAGLLLALGSFPTANGMLPVSAAQVAAVPDGPDGLEAFPADRDPIKIGLLWSDNSDDEDGFEVFRRIFTEDDSNEYRRIGAVGPNVTEFVDGDIRNNIQYEYRVRAFNEDGPSFFSNSVVAFFGTPGKIRVEPTRIDFGNVRVGAERNRRFTIRNTGRSNVTVNVAMVDEGGPYSIIAGGGDVDIAPGQSARVTVQYAPTQPGRDNAQVSVTLNDVELRVRLRAQAGNDGGGGGSRIKVAPIPLDFGRVRVGTTRTRQFTIRNTGRETASVTIALAPGGPFRIIAGGGDVDIPPGASHRVTVTFTPESRGRAQSVATVMLGESTVSVRLKGVGVPIRR